MKSLNNILILLIGSAVFCNPVRGKNPDSTQYPIIGKPCPNFVLTDIRDYTKKETSLDDLKGKHVILDFWAEGCISCIHSFPKLNKLQQQYKDKLNIILVGLESPNIRRIYEKLKIKYNLNLPSAFDSIISGPPFKKIAGVPWLIWIDDKGIVKAVSSSAEMTSDNIEKFIANEEFSFLDESYNSVSARNNSYNADYPFLVNGNGGAKDTDFLYRSVLTKWKPGIHVGNRGNIDLLWESQKIPRFEVFGVPVIFLYEIAFTGSTQLLDSMYFAPVFETSDSSLLSDSNKSTYCYSVSIPKEKASKDYLMKVMQNDLKNYFGFTAKIEEREAPCLFLTITDESKFEKLKSKRDLDVNNSVIEVDYVNLVNCNIGAVADVLKYSTKEGVLRIFNKTGYSGNLDIQVNAVMTDLEDVRKEIRKQGLDIVKGNNKMKVLVITDNVN